MPLNKYVIPTIQSNLSVFILSMKSYTKTIDISPRPQNVCVSTDQQRPLPADFQTPPRGGKSSYCPPEQTSEVANTMCELVGGGERGPMGARAVLTRLKLVFPRLLSCCLSIAHSDSRQLKFLFEDVLLLDCVPILREPTHCY